MLHVVRWENLVTITQSNLLILPSRIPSRIYYTSATHFPLGGKTSAKARGKDQVNPGCVWGFPTSGVFLFGLVGLLLAPAMMPQLRFQALFPHALELIQIRRSKCR
jgi:hypothetical protein